MEVLGITVEIDPGSLDPHQFDTGDTKCDGCGKSMLYDGWESTGRNGGQSQGPSMTFVGITLEVITPNSSPSWEAFLKKQLGKYEIDKRYEFCWECWLDSLRIAHSHF